MINKIKYYECKYGVQHNRKSKTYRNHGCYKPEKHQE